ncbi:carbon-nitrogen hydrolase family protein [Histidinibacterium lentulum]|uniref:Nitrilase n=1 Tax=Histidinibacterium lentulum TaxID=2480588 RepID=A0A3N2QWA2_9RHOB|nr:carbon-nitrogen hydrolase family protein [Histidinibacterium lentulum]ROT99466.1 nitrilase [Histidinibacterium lentulum]
MRIGLYQAPSPAGDIPAGLAALDAALGKAAGAGVDLLVMPELFLPGYGATTATPPPGWAETMKTVADLARTHAVALAIGLPEYGETAVWNAAFVFDETGAEIARYRKVQLFGDREHALFTPGDRLVTFDWRGRRFGLLICYDVEFPEHVRALATAGAEVILVPTANMMPFVNVNQIMVPSRAAENAVTIVYANCCGTEGALDYVGLSLICGPEGYPLASKGRDAGLLIAELPEPGWREHDIPHSTQAADLRKVGVS